MVARVSLVCGVCSLLSTAAFVPWRAGEPPPKGPPPRPVSVYAAEPDHLWNRVHAALWVRTGPDGKDYGHDRLEPLLWRESDHLLAGVPADRAVAVLEEFDRESGEALIDDPVKRAVLQRDLWLVSNWLAGTRDAAARRRLERPLDAAIRRLALTPRQLAGLADNYAAAVASKKHPARFDPERPDRAYLPPDLFADAGPWVCVAPADGPAAPFHLDDRGTNPFGNSVFFVFLKLPGGREKTLNFLARPAALDELLVPNTDEATKRLSPALPNPAFPTWPKGTEVALVRRALLVGADGRVVASRLTESVQPRAITADTPALTADVLEAASARRPPAGWQAAFEFQLGQADLFAGAAGGLRDVSGERDFKTGFGSHPADEFDRKSGGGTFPERSLRGVTNRASCGTCHTHPGAYSFNSVPGFAFGGSFQPPPDDAPQKRPPVPATVAEVEGRAVKWMEGRPAWVAFVKRAGK